MAKYPQEVLIDKPLMSCLVLILILLGVVPVRASSSTRTFWTTQDIIDQRISVDAQYSLIRMCRTRDDAKRADATSMLLAILDDKTLAGIYQVDHQPPAMRAGDLGVGWWNLIPKGKDSTCVKGVGGTGESAPMIVYSKSIGSYDERVDQALNTAWKMCKEVYGLSSREPLPCVVARRSPAGEWDECSEEKRQQRLGTFHDCLYERIPPEENLQCLEVCGKTGGIDWECVAKRAECASTLEADKVCVPYTRKHVPCP